MRTLRTLLVSALPLAAAGCIETTIYRLDGDQYAVTERGAGHFTVRHLETDEIIEDSSDGPGPFARRLSREGEQIGSSEEQQTAVDDSVREAARESSRRAEEEMTRRVNESLRRLQQDDNRKGGGF